MAGKTTKKSPFDCAAFYTITSKLSGKAVTACGESEVRMFAPTVEDRQQWKLVAADTGAYRLISKTTGKALDIMLAGENDGAQLHQWKEDISAPTQSWVLEQTQDGSYKIKPLYPANAWILLISPCRMTPAFKFGRISTERTKNGC